jgi:para-nitrobenzyl esterase
LNADRQGGAREAAGAPVAETRRGKVRGAVVNGISVFRGIPYGRPMETRVFFQSLPRSDRFV